MIAVADQSGRMCLGRSNDELPVPLFVGTYVQIPFNKLVVEEVLMARDSASVLPKDVFAKAMLEVSRTLR